MPISSEMKKAILQGEFDNTFSVLYGEKPEVIEKQRKRYSDAIAKFDDMYGADKEISIYSTPGRTEISGNHTDHNNGRVMAASVNLDIVAVVARASDNFIRVLSEGFGSPDIVDLSYLQPVNLEYGKSSALVRGVAAAVKDRGGYIGGVEVYTTSDVLRGSGLSSSAAFEVCIATILNEEYNNGKFSPVELAIMSQYAENKFFGKPSGLMDQTACSVGNVITIDFENLQKPIVNTLPLKLSEYGYKLVITDTKGSHAGLTDEYASIRHEMESVAKYFGKSNLREVSYEEFLKEIPEIRTQDGDRAVLRSLHFFAECNRVNVLVKAIEEKDFEKFKEIILESGNSSFEYNQNAYSVRRPEEQGVSLGLALSQLLLQGRGAWRLQGGGFAGTIQAFVPEDLLEKYCEELERVFGKGACYVLDIRSFGSIKVTDSL